MGNTSSTQLVKISLSPPLPLSAHDEGHSPGTDFFLNTMNYENASFEVHISAL
jgi:hypothetical protein